MIKVHYKNGSTYTLRNNNWREVPNKNDIVAIDIISEFTGQVYSIRKPASEKVQFFAQRVGLAEGFGRVVNKPFVAEEVGMIFSNGKVEILEVGWKARRYTTTIQKLGFNKLSFEMLGLNYEEKERSST